MKMCQVTCQPPLILPRRVVCTNDILLVFLQRYKWFLIRSWSIFDTLPALTEQRCCDDYLKNEYSEYSCLVVLLLGSALPKALMYSVCLRLSFNIPNLEQWKIHKMCVKIRFNTNLELFLPIMARGIIITINYLRYISRETIGYNRFFD